MILKILFNKFRNFFQDNVFKKIIKNSGIIFFGNSTASAINLVSFTVMANQLGPKTLAVIVLAQTYCMVINDIFNIQTWESMVKFGSEKKNWELASVIKTNFLLDFVSAIFAFLFAWSLVWPIGNLLGWDNSFFNIISLYCFYILFNITSFTIGIPRLFDKFLAIAKIQVVMALLKLLAIVSALLYKNDLTVYASIYLGIDILTNLSLILYSFGLLRKNLPKGWWTYKVKINKEHIRFIWWTNLRTIIRIPVRHFDIIVTSYVLSIKMVGIYKVYKELAGIISRIGEPVNQSIFPEFTKLIGRKDLNKAASVVKKMIFLQLGVSFVITLPLILISNFLVSQFLGQEYIKEIHALYALLVLNGISFVIVPINSLFIAAGFVKLSFLIILFTNTIYLITAFSFGIVIGIYGIILALATQMFLNQGLKVLFLKKYSTEWGQSAR